MPGLRSPQTRGGPARAKPPQPEAEGPSRAGPPPGSGYLGLNYPSFPGEGAPFEGKTGSTKPGDTPSVEDDREGGMGTRTMRKRGGTAELEQNGHGLTARERGVVDRLACGW